MDIVALCKAVGVEDLIPEAIRLINQLSDLTTRDLVDVESDVCAALLGEPSHVVQYGLMSVDLPEFPQADRVRFRVAGYLNQLRVGAG